MKNIFEDYHGSLLLQIQQNQGTHEIDLVSMESFATTLNNQVYTHVLSILNIFSRYLWLRATAGNHHSAEMYNT